MELQQYQELLKLLHQLLKEQTAAKEHTNYELATAKQEIEHLKSQLVYAHQTIASKEETISLLRGTYRNPN